MSIHTTVILTSVDELFGGSPESSAYKQRVSFDFENKITFLYYRHFECVHFSLFTINETLRKKFTSVDIDFIREICNFGEVIKYCT